MADDLIEQLRIAATEIAAAGHAGWGNAMICAADELSRLRGECSQWTREISTLVEANESLRAEVEALRQERQGWVDSSKMHESWLTKPREALLDGLRFQGETTAHLLEETTRLTGKLEAAKSALCKYGRHTISTDPACQMYANSSLPCNCGYIAAIDAARTMP